MAGSTAGARQTQALTVSGSAALSFVLFIAAIAGLATWAASDANAHKVIGEQAGKVVAIGLAVVFALAAMGPTLARRFPKIGGGLEAVEGALEPIGIAASGLDRALVSWVAPLAGATLNTTAKRYTVLVAHLGLAALLAYWLQQNEGQAWPWVQGAYVAHWASFVPLGWGFILAFAVSRRWAWIEADREQAMLTGIFEKVPESGIRIGFDQDLRDEALLSFMFMFLFAPLAFSQLDKYGVFAYSPGWVPDYTDWLGFFGAELAKAVPFVDWAETYNVGSGTRIEPTKGVGQHVVFAARVLIDLIVLAALLQAMQISGRISRQRAEFRSGRLPRLDPFLERAEFAGLVAGGDAFAPEKILNFKYDIARLQTLVRSRNYGVEVRAIALRLLGAQEGAELYLPGMLLERVAGAHGHEPDSSRRIRALAAKLLVQRDDDASVGALRAALEADVNSDRHEARQSLVRLVGNMSAPASYTLLEFCAKSDKHRSVRVEAMKQIVARRGPAATVFLVERGLNPNLTRDEMSEILALFAVVANQSVADAKSALAQLFSVERYNFGERAKRLSGSLPSS